MAGSLTALLACSVVTLLVLVVVPADAWSGNSDQLCSYTACCYRRVRVCKYRWWGRCCSYKYINQAYWCQKQRCCSGWTHNGDQRCTIPVCRPSCKNGGTCVSPGVCDCPVQFDGYRCGGAVCSHLAPCFPGVCQNGDGCDCQSGFTTATTNDKQNYCLKIEDNTLSRLDMYEMQVRLSYWPRYAPEMGELHWIMADSSNVTTTDSFWTNRKDFNRLETSIASEFVSQDLTGQPAYIRDFKLGVVAGDVKIYLEKLGPSGSAGTFVSLNKTISCEQSVSFSNPNEGIFNCSVTDLNFDRLLEHRDKLEVRFTTKSGGYRDVTDNNFSPPRLYLQQEFTGFQREKAVEFKIDFLLPVHCGLQNPPCQGADVKDPLNVPDFTSSATLPISWKDWTDADSGMYRYAWEVFKLTRVDQDELEVKYNVALKPLINQEVFHDNYAPQTFTLPEPGMYCVILEAGDLANNTRYVRRLVLFDPNPTISTDPDHEFYVTSASEAANRSYSSGINQPLVVTWDKHFRNAFHEDNDLLGRVRPYPKELRDLVGDNKYAFNKDIQWNLTYDDWEGARTVEAVANRRAIVKFDFAFKTGRREVPDSPTEAQPPIPWNNANLNTTVTIPGSVNEGETLTVWVKATDFMGTQKVKRTQVTYDSTPPIVNGTQGIRFLMNVHAEGVPFSSTFTMEAKDQQSGIAYVDWTFTRKSNGVVKHRQRMAGVRKPNSACFSGCTCLGDECFAHSQSFSISNCAMIVDKASLAKEVILVTADVTNMAGLVTRVTMEKDDLTALNGTKAYFPPQNITVIGLTKESCTLTWSFPPSCFNRTALWVVVNGDKRAVHKDAQSFALTGLEPGTDYTVYMVTDFEGQEQSDPAPVRFSTVEADGLGAGAIAGIIIGFLIIALLIVLIVIFCLWRRGVIFQKEGSTVNTQLRRVDRGLTVVRKTVFSNGAYDKSGDDEIYMYGEMTFKSPPAWQLADADLTLMDRLQEGKFATVYKAVWTQNRKQDTVAAKMLKPGFSEDDALKMMAKINFAATKLEDHANVVTFLGAVTDNEGWGPVLVMGLCEGGQMDKWLLAQRDHVTEKVMGNLNQFSVGIARAMEYLASKQVIHKRLAARNVLLTFLLEVKVAGFGPQHKEGDENKTTKVPAKWAAPEVLQDRPATEKSDVWSYGVVLWEIFSMGQTPYANVAAAQMGTELKRGFRMDKPEFADDSCHDLMTDCWHYKPGKRPAFASVRARVDKTSDARRQSQDFYYDTNQLKAGR